MNAHLVGAAGLEATGNQGESQTGRQGDGKKRRKLLTRLSLLVSLSPGLFVSPFFLAKPLHDRHVGDSPLAFFSRSAAATAIAAVIYEKSFDRFGRRTP